MDRTARGEYQAKQKDEDGPASKRMAQPSNTSLSTKLILRSRESAGQPTKKSEPPCKRSKRRLSAGLHFLGPPAKGVFFWERTSKETYKKSYIIKLTSPPKIDRLIDPGIHEGSPHKAG
jgi:hypothetical protein